MIFFLAFNLVLYSLKGDKYNTFLEFEVSMWVYRGSSRAMRAICMNLNLTTRFIHYGPIFVGSSRAKTLLVYFLIA